MHMIAQNVQPVIVEQRVPGLYTVSSSLGGHLGRRLDRHRHNGLRLRGRCYQTVGGSVRTTSSSERGSASTPYTRSRLIIGLARWQEGSLQQYRGSHRVARPRNKSGRLQIRKL